MVGFSWPRMSAETFSKTLAFSSVVVFGLALAVAAPAAVRCIGGDVDSCASKIDAKWLSAVISSTATDDMAVSRVPNAMGLGEFVTALPWPQTRSLVMSATGR